MFGNYDGWVDGKSDELTLVRALQHVFGNGASTVYAVRTGAAEAASLTLNDDTGPVVKFAGKTPGTWAREITVAVKAATENGFVEERRQDVGGGALQPLHAHIVASPRNAIRITRGASGKTARLALAITGTPQKGRRAVVNPADGVLTFHADDTPVSGDKLAAAYVVDKAFCRQIEIKYRNVTEDYTAIDATDIERDVGRASSLVGVTIQAGGDARVPNVTVDPLVLGRRRRRRDGRWDRVCRFSGEARPRAHQHRAPRGSRLQRRGRHAEGARRRRRVGGTRPHRGAWRGRGLGGQGRRQCRCRCRRAAHPRGAGA